MGAFPGVSPGPAASSVPAWLDGSFLDAITREHDSLRNRRLPVPLRSICEGLAVVVAVGLLPQLRGGGGQREGGTQRPAMAQGAVLSVLICRGQYGLPVSDA
jgi:hypothetical protein